MFESNYATGDRGSKISALAEEAIATIMMTAAPERARPSNRQVVDILNNEFRHIDADKDGTLSKSELTAYSQLPGLSIQSKSVTQFAARNIEQFAELASDKSGTAVPGSNNADGLSIYNVFLKDNKAGLTLKDVSVLSQITPDSDLANSINKLRSSERWNWASSAMWGLLAVGHTACTIVNPEPTTKYYQGGMAVCAATLSASYAAKALQSAAPTLRDQFQQRQRMIASWK